jgi:hypothetical protein
MLHTPAALLDVKTYLNGIVRIAIGRRETCGAWIDMWTLESRYSNSIGHRVRLGAALEGCLAVAPLDPLRGVVLGAWPDEARSRLELDLG